MRRLVLTCVVCGIAAWIIAAQNPAPSHPFATTPSVEGITGGAANLLFRNAGGTYTQLAFSTTPPYAASVKDAAALASLLAGGVSNLLAAPKGPANTAVQSSSVAYGRLGPNGSPGMALVESGGVRVYMGSVALGLVSTVLLANTPEFNLGGGIAAADLNSDGRDDLVIAVWTQQTAGVLVYLNNGDGTFRDRQTVIANQTVGSFALFDVNRDSKLDLVRMSFVPRALTFRPGNGDGTFGAPVISPTPMTPIALVMADFNGDGNVDALVTGQQSSVAFLMTGTGAGAFNGTSSFVLDASGGLPAVGDFDQDGKLDVVVALNVLTVWRGNGDGTFRRGSSYALRGGTPIVTDYNADGDPDIVLGHGDARLILSPFATNAAGHSMEIYLGGPGASFHAPEATLAATSPTSWISMADFNGDGKLDVPYISNFRQELQVFASRGDGSFQALGEPRQVALESVGHHAAGDFDRDGKADLAIALRGSNEISILRGRGDGTFFDRVLFPSGGMAPVGLVAADFDGDGRLDLAASHLDFRTSPLVLFRGSGDGTFTIAQTLLSGVGGILQAADFNRDNRPDLLLYGGAGLYTFRNVGGQFQSAVTLTTTPTTQAAIADFNNDGHLDLASLPNSTPRGVVIWTGDANGVFRVKGDPLVDTSSFAAADFNRDGNADLVFHSFSDDPMVAGAGFLAGKGDGTFQAPVRMNGGMPANVLTVADLNDDGGPDLIGVLGPGYLVGLLSADAPLVNVNGASFDSTRPVAQDSIVTAKGSNLATAAVYQGENLPLVLGGTKVEITDSRGFTRGARIFFVSDSQVNYVLPPGTATGLATVRITAGDGKSTAGTVAVVGVSPGVIALNATGLAAAVVVRLRDGQQIVEQWYQVSGNAVVPAPIDLGPEGDEVYLLLFGTGFRHATAASVTLGGLTMPGAAWAAHSLYPGLDQANLGPLPRSLAGRGQVNLVLTADGIASNPTNLGFR